MIDTIRGNLLSDSPGLALYLRNHLSPSELKAVAEAYSESVKLGGCNEGLVERDPEVSYNPRPARILKLLIEECGVSDVDLMIDALKALPLFESFEAGAVATTLTNIREKSANRLNKAEHLLGVMLLDYLRHLHMSKISPEGLSAILKEAGDTLTRITAEIPQKLQMKISDTISKQLRRVG